VSRFKSSRFLLSRDQFLLATPPPTLCLDIIRWWGFRRKLNSCMDYVPRMHGTHKIYIPTPLKKSNSRQFSVILIHPLLSFSAFTWELLQRAQPTYGVGCIPTAFCGTPRYMQQRHSRKKLVLASEPALFAKSFVCLDLVVHFEIYQARDDITPLQIRCKEVIAISLNISQSAFRARKSWLWKVWGILHDPIVNPWCNVW